MTWLRPTVFVLLPFAAGYYLSYLFRVINAVIAKPLVDELALDACSLGLLTALYFLTFAAVQLPLGIALDRFGARRVQAALLMLAAVGSAIFALAPGYFTLAIGRCLIGIGVAGALIGGLKAVAASFPKEQLPIVRGLFVACGAAGAVTATEPAAWLVAWLDWRGVFLLLSATTVIVAVATLLIVAEPTVLHATRGQKAVDIRGIYRDARFWRLAPISALSIGSAWALQGLWAALWLADVAMLDRAAVVHHLFVMACALCAGALLLGICADAARRRGIGPDRVLAFAVLLFLAAELALVLRLPVPSSLLWGMVGAMGAATVLSYGIIGDLFPAESSGRANAALNVLHIGAAFAIQGGMGLIVGLWSRDGQGHYPVTAYNAAFLGLVGLQVLALAWFMRPTLRSMASGWKELPSLNRLGA
jgi:predicted MFS family arabinose efflux permease